jgi:hypothetical protein
MVDSAKTLSTVNEKVDALKTKLEKLESSQALTPFGNMAPQMESQVWVVFGGCLEGVWRVFGLSNRWSVSCIMSSRAYPGVFPSRSLPTSRC